MRWNLPFFSSASCTVNVLRKFSPTIPSGKWNAEHSSKLAEREFFKGMRIAFPEASPSTALGSLLLNPKLKRRKKKKKRKKRNNPPPTKQTTNKKPPKPARNKEGCYFTLCPGLQLCGKGRLSKQKPCRGCVARWAELWSGIQENQALLPARLPVCWKNWTLSSWHVW